MIIDCPHCKKKFEVDENLIPDAGRLLKCGTCEQTWFFNKNSLINNNPHEEDLIKENLIEKKNSNNTKINKDETIKIKDNLPKKKGSELIKYKSKSNFTISKFLSYIIVLIISFIALIIFLDTFKNPLSVFFPNLELILYNLFETLRDLILFVKDLN